MPNIDIKLYEHYDKYNKDIFKKYVSEQVENQNLFDMIFKVSVGAIQQVINTPKWKKWNPGFRFPEHHDPGEYNWVYKDIVPKLVYQDINRDEVLERYAKVISEVKILLIDKRFLFRKAIPKLWIYITIKTLEIISAYLVFENENKSIEQIIISYEQIEEKATEIMVRLRNEMLWAAFPSLNHEAPRDYNSSEWSEENE